MSMLDIFRMEVEAHAETLTKSLLALEQDPVQPKRLEELMRAAHSIKGAARIVGIEPAVRLAHAMEDAFVAAQKGNVRLSPEAVDRLLAGVDTLNQIGTMTGSPPPDWVAALGPPLADLVQAI